WCVDSHLATRKRQRAAGESEVVEARDHNVGASGQTQEGFASILFLSSPSNLRFQSRVVQAASSSSRIRTSILSGRLIMNRREFVKRGAAATTLAALPSVNATAQKASN